MRIHRKVHWKGDHDYVVTLTGHCDARPTQVYDLLADLGSHTDWGGDRQYRGFRLVSQEASAAIATVGVEFHSVGRIPMTSVVNDNHNTVTIAHRPERLAFTTRTTIDWTDARRLDLPPRGGPAAGVFHHDYTITADGDSSQVTYMLTQERFDRPPWGMRIPPVRVCTHRVTIPLWLARGFRNMLTTAEQTVEVGEASQTTSGSPRSTDVVGRSR